MFTHGPLVVGMTGASVPKLTIRLLQTLQVTDVETHLVISSGARRTIALEAPEWTVAGVEDLADVAYSPYDMAAAIASGSFLTRGMVILPCSMKAVAAIAYSLASDLLVRGADVTLKESRPLVLVPRESPLHLGHLRNLVRTAELGATVMPPMLGTYYSPKSVDDVVDHIVGRVLDHFGIENDLVERWVGGAQPRRKATDTE